MLPGQIDTPERVFYGIMIWGEGVYELKYESISIKGYRPEPYTHLWKFIYPSPMQQPSEVVCKALAANYGRLNFCYRAGPTG